MAEKEARQKPSESILLPKSILSYPHLFKPSSAAKDGSNPKYSGQFLISKDEDIKAAQKACFAQAKEMFGADQKKWKNPKDGQFHWPIVDGDKIVDTQPEAANCWVIKGSSKGDFRPPIVVGKNKKPLTEAEAYPGSIVMASVKFQAFNNAGKRGVTVILEGVMKIADGKPLGEAKDAETLFGAIGTEDDGDEESFNIGDDESNDVDFES